MDFSKKRENGEGMRKEEKERNIKRKDTHKEKTSFIISCLITQRMGNSDRGAIFNGFQGNVGCGVSGASQTCK